MCSTTWADQTHPTSEATLCDDELEGPCMTFRRRRKPSSPRCAIAQKLDFEKYTGILRLRYRQRRWCCRTESTCTRASLLGHSPPSPDSRENPSQDLLKTCRRVTTAALFDALPLGHHAPLLQPVLLILCNLATLTAVTTPRTPATTCFLA